MISVTSSQLDVWIATLLWPFLRLLALFASAPVLRDRTIPTRMKIGLALAIALVVAPTLPGPPVPLSSPGAPLVIAQQLLVGVAIGFALRIVFAAVELAGELIGLQMGLSFAGFVDPQSGVPAPIVGTFLGVIATLAFLAFDGHLLLVATIVESFHVVPVSPELGAATNAARLVAWGGELFRLALQLALPVLGTLLLLNLALGMLSRAAPQLNIFAVGFPAALLAGFAVLLIALPLFVPAFESALAAAFRFVLPR